MDEQGGEIQMEYTSHRSTNANICILSDKKIPEQLRGKYDLYTKNPVCIK